MADAFPNQLTGDPVELEIDGTAYSDTSDAIAHAIEDIRLLGSDRFSSHAVTALDRNQGDVVAKITRIQYRYHEAGAALVAYAKALRQAQEQAARAIAAHGPLHDQATTLQYRIAEETQLAQQPGPDQMAHIQLLQQLADELRDVQAQQGDALAIWNDAKAQKDAAARSARIAIHVADEKNDLNDDLWDSLATVIPVLLLIDRIAQTVLKIVSLVLTILAIVFAVLSLIFPILAPVAAALFGYAQLVNLAIAVLALLAFLLDGFHLMDLLLVGIAVAATFAAAGLGQVLGSAAQGAVSSALADVDEVAGDAAGAIAKNAISEGVKDLAKAEVGDLLFHGSNEAQQLFDEVGGPAVDGLNSLAASEISTLKEAAQNLGNTVGDVAKAGLDATPFPDILHMPFRELSSFADSGGLGNLDWAKDGWQAVQDHLIDPGRELWNQGNALATQVAHLNPGGALFHPGGPLDRGPMGLSSGDVNGDKIGDVGSGAINDWVDAASHGHWGGAAQWVVDRGGIGISGETVTGAMGDRVGDLFGNMQDAHRDSFITYATAHSAPQPPAPDVPASFLQ
jgi:hypothetical protein